ncbi:Carbohydrate esterase family 3 protein [Coniochaeta hoffmannii]|uniref:Carbohydrate esterase family 3 protein n=1 Tax=Coniochaeta hoffmannii TaxID=91930 RepID=A0AA38VU40_9PEZI|nr:Carbohydrate esterase family 3 protein [Coniochaeta hoffmannii]
MPLGASVTYGVGSSTGSSYRRDLRDLLVSAANQTVDMVGTRKHGDFADNDVEATSGFAISQIAEAAATAVPRLLPNLVLVDAGTNNCNGGGTVPDAGANVTAMIEEMFLQSPGVTVVLATILGNAVAAQDACRVDINAQYVALVARLRAAGGKVLLVDLRGSEGPITNDLVDGRHPNDVGYRKMAGVWFEGIQQAISQGLVTTAC